MTTYNLTGDQAIQQGATYTKSIVWKDGAGVVMNLTGYSAKMQIRSSVSAPKVLAEIATSPGSGIALGGALGTIDLTISATLTGAIGEVAGVYDLELTSSGGVVTRLLEGAVEITPQVTR
jgi:hypothetical protein